MSFCLLASRMILCSRRYFIVLHCGYDQLQNALKDRFQVLHKQLGSAGFAKQDALSGQLGQLKDLHTQATAALTRARRTRVEAFDSTCVMMYAELVGTLKAMDVPAIPSAAAGAEVEVLGAPVSTASLRVSLDTSHALATINAMGAIQVHYGCGGSRKCELDFVSGIHDCVFAWWFADR